MEIVILVRKKTCCEESSYKCLDYLENYLMKTVAPPENVSAIFFEPFFRSWRNGTIT